MTEKKKAAAKPKAGAEETAIVKVGETYPILASGAEKVLEVVKANLGSGEVSPFELDRIKIPAGGGSFWEVPDLDDSIVTEKELEGIIIFTKLNRAFWHESDDADGSPPDCHSHDGETGQGDLNQDGTTTSQPCSTCPFAQWGSAGEKSKGQACKLLQIVFLLRPNDYLPTVITLPPTSVKTIRKFMLRLASKGVPYWGVEVSVGLEVIKADHTYSVATFKVNRRLDAKEVEVASQFKEALMVVLDKVQADIPDDDIPDANGDDE